MALWARARLRFEPRAAHVAPFPLVPINTPLGSSVWRDPEFRASCCNFVFGFVVVVLPLLVLGLAIRVKERECVKGCI